MRKTGKKWIVLGVGSLLVAVLLPGGLWVLLSLQPKFYKELRAIPVEVRQVEAKKFVAQSLQLRNDIRNEPKWEATFTDQEINSWLAEDLVNQFADQIPPGVSDPRVSFENDRMTIAFELENGPVRSVVWLVASIKVPQANTFSLTLEKVRAGLVPIPPGQLVDRIDEYARLRGFKIDWDNEPGMPPTATLVYVPSGDRTQIVLEKILIRQGELRLSGRSENGDGRIAMPGLPGRSSGQSSLPGTNTSDQDDAAVPATARSSSRPKS